MKPLTLTLEQTRKAARSATLSVDAVDPEARRRADAACEALTNLQMYVGGLAERVSALARQTAPVGKVGLGGPEQVFANRLERATIFVREWDAMLRQGTNHVGDPLLMLLAILEGRE